MRIPVLLALTACVAMAQQRDFEWHGPIARGSFIEIRGINGNVRAMPSTSGEVEVEADVESGVQVQFMRHQNGVTVCSVFPGEKICRPLGDTGPGARVNFVVRVPEGVNFLGSTVNGGVEANALKSDVQAYTVNGQVRVTTTGTVQAKTVNGSITASLLKPFWSKPAELTTVNGGITLVLPSTANAALEAATKNGKIVTDFNARGKVTDQEVIGRIGGGGSRLVLNTVNGTIALKRGA
ncbi:MAG TPA: DUF4097 family beta strand repeat-containing protein [Bryobacteraceae bacterium]|nr:DUF4097 family beta strand repeat-containing protein [Bryobacteraceae bacterium]